MSQTGGSEHSEETEGIWLDSICQILLQGHRRKLTDESRFLLIADVSGYKKTPEEASVDFKWVEGSIVLTWEPHLDFDATHDSQAARNDDGNVKSRAKRPAHSSNRCQATSGEQE